jgi:hypothetical protein
MKNAILSIAFATFLLTLGSSLSAQTVNTWKGGAPGHETDWHFYKNWSLGKTPDEFQKVIIPDVSTTTQRYPVLRSGEVETGSLEIRPNAQLTLKGNACLLTENLENSGGCIGCEGRVQVKGTPQKERNGLAQH